MYFLSESVTFFFKKYSTVYYNTHSSFCQLAKAHLFCSRYHYFNIEYGRM